jgi:hypothetical protein
MENNNLFLKEKDFKALIQILSDVRQSTDCDIAVGGSVAQRILIPEFAKSVAKKKLKDIDLLLLSSSLSDCSVLPQIKKYFYVLSISKSFNGYYFGLIHKKTGKWVDLFPLSYIRPFASAKIGEEAYKIETISSQVLYLAHNLLWRVKSGFEVRCKWVQKLEFLYSQPSLDIQAAEKEFLLYKEVLMEDFPKEMMDGTSVRSFVSDTIEYVKPFAKKERKHWFRQFKNYYKNSITTPNGISMDSRFVLLKTIFQG